MLGIHCVLSAALLMRRCAACLCLAAIPGGAFAQGNLDPTRPPAPLMKTLFQVEPRIDVATLSGDGLNQVAISQPGSYYLSDDLGISSTHGILINAENVTLDLNGFEIKRTSGTGGVGIRIAGPKHGLSVRNGSITGFEVGVRSITLYAQGCLFEGLSVSDCTTVGILAGVASRVVNCRSYDNGGDGIEAQDGSVVTGCTVSNNGGIGIKVEHGCTISDCTAFGNAGNAIDAERGCTITDCSVFLNTGNYGIRGDGAVTIRGCTVVSNEVDSAIYALAGSTVQACTASHNRGKSQSTQGILASQGSLVLNCVASYNTHTEPEPTVTQGRGIQGIWGSTVRNCTVRANSGDGIVTGSYCFIVGNDSANNGDSDGAGIRVVGVGSRIENNNVVYNKVGIEVATAGNVGNLIIRNSARGNTVNYDIVASNKVGPIVNAPSSGAIYGSTGGAGVGTTNPWANFSY